MRQSFYVRSLFPCHPVSRIVSVTERWRLLDNSLIRQLADCQLADWTTRGLDISRTGQLADAIGEFAYLVFLFGGICESASGPVRDLSSPRVGNPRVGVSASCPVTKMDTVASCLYDTAGNSEGFDTAVNMNCSVCYHLLVCIHNIVGFGAF